MRDNVPRLFCFDVFPDTVYFKLHNGLANSFLRGSGARGNMSKKSSPQKSEKTIIENMGRKKVCGRNL